MEWEVEQEFSKIYRILKCKQNCGGNSGSLPIIEVSLAEYDALLNANNLTFPAIYAISITTPLVGVVYVLAISNNTVESSGFAKLYVPSYTIAGDFKGQLLNGDIPAIGEKWVWGNTVWRSLDGSTPAPLSSTQLDPASWQALTPSVANGYILKEFLVVTSKPYLTITQLSDADALNIATQETKLLMQWNTEDSLTAYNETITVVNNFNLGYIIHNWGHSTSEISLNYVNSSSNITYNSLFNGNIQYNLLTGNGSIGYNIVRSTCAIKNNTISGVGVITLPQIGYCELNDNSTVEGNVLSGAGACIWDVRAGENSSVRGNTLSGDESGTPTTDACIITDIDQMNADFIEYNTLEATDNRIEMIWQYGNSSVNHCVLSEPGCKIRRIQQTDSQISYCSFSNGSGCTGFEDIFMKSASISNATDININHLNLDGAALNLSGFTVNIANETIENGKGWFEITHDFSASPLSEGTDVLYNLIPTGARVISCGIFVESPLSGGIAAQLSLGVSVDDTTCFLNSVAVGSVTDNFSSGVLSTKTTDNRSLVISATGDDITSGVLKVFIEFVM